MSVSTVPVFTLKPSSGRLLYVPGGSISHPLLQLSFSSSRLVKRNLSVSRLAIKPIPSRFSPLAVHALNWVEEEGEDALVDELGGNVEDESEDDFENETEDHDEPVAQMSDREIYDDEDDDDEDGGEFTEDSNLSYVDEDNERMEAEMSDWESEEEDDDDDEGDFTEDDEDFEAELSELESEDDQDTEAELSELESDDDEDIEAELSELESDDGDDDYDDEGDNGGVGGYDVFPENVETENIESSMSDGNSEQEGAERGDIRKLDEASLTGSGEIERIPSTEESEYESVHDPSLDSDGLLQEHLEEAKLFVGNLTYDVDSRMLAERFRDAGTVEIAEVIYNWETNQSRGFGFVTMSSVAEADKAVQMLHHREMGGRIMVVHKAVARGSRPARVQASHGFKIYCGNVSYNVDDALLHEVFSRHGEVLSAVVICDRDTGMSRGFAFVTMSTLSGQENAIAALDGYLLDGRKIRVAKAEDRARFGTMRTGYGFARSGLTQNPNDM